MFFTALALRAARAPVAAIASGGMLRLRWPEAACASFAFTLVLACPLVFVLFLGRQSRVSTAIFAPVMMAVSALAVEPAASTAFLWEVLARRLPGLAASHSSVAPYLQVLVATPFRHAALMTFLTVFGGGMLLVRAIADIQNKPPGRKGLSRVNNGLPGTPGGAVPDSPSRKDSRPTKNSSTAQRTTPTPVRSGGQDAKPLTLKRGRKELGL